MTNLDDSSLLNQDQLAHHVYRDLTFAPCVMKPGRSRADFGVFDAEGRPVAAFDHPWAVHRAIAEAPAKASGPAIYGGMLMNHFGHFLIEAMSRLWFIRAHPELPVVWHSINLPVPHDAWPGWREEVWRLLGLDRSRHQIIQAPLRVEQVILPQPGVRSDGRLHPIQRAALACVASAEEPTDARIWLSRTALPRQFGRIDGEEAMESRLAAEGWRVLRPETLPVRAQAAMFAQAGVIAGFAGSAFHAVLLTSAPRARLILLDRPSVNRNYYENIAASRGLRQSYVSVPVTPLGPVHAWTSYRLSDPAATVDLILAMAEAPALSWPRSYGELLSSSG